LHWQKIAYSLSLSRILSQAKALYKEQWALYLDHIIMEGTKEANKKLFYHFPLLLLGQPTN
jgi:hypothetical protein